MPQSTNAGYVASQGIDLAHNLTQDLQVAIHIRDTYQLGGLQTEVDALANDTDMVPGTPFDKQGFIQFITSIDLFIKLMNNIDVPQGEWKVGLLRAAALKETP